jgi:6-phosphogluconolactonase
VPIDDAQSNYRMTRESLLDAIKLEPRQIHRVRTELIPDEAALAYAEEIRQILGDEPVFDVIQRGMGADAHTASLFPREPLIENTTGIAAAVWVPKMGQFRVTLLRGVLERARKTVNLVTGADKRDALHAVMHGPVDYMQRPAMISSADVIWYLDHASATSS